MADLITRLLLNTQQFDNNLGKSTKQIQGFQQKIQGFSSGAVSAFTKFAGVLGVAYGATELLQKGLNSNATLQDKYNSLMQAGSTVTDQFFTAIYSGDWTVFNDGIEKAIKNAKEYADTYRNVQRMLETTSIKFEQTDARKTQLEAIIEDDTKPLEERKKAQQELDRILLMGVADIREASQITERELNNMLADLIGEAQYITTENAQKLILDIRNKYSELRKELDAYREIRDTKNQVLNPNAFKYSGDEWYKNDYRSKQNDHIIQEGRFMWGFIVALISGALMSIQGVFNTEVTKQTSLWVSTGWVQLSAFAVCVLAWFFTGRESVAALWQVDNKYTLLGGVIGAFITITVIQSMGALGPAKAAMLIVISQLAVAYVIELFGLFGVDKEPFEWRKILGLLIAISGIVIFKWQK